MLRTWERDVLRGTAARDEDVLSSEASLLDRDDVLGSETCDARDESDAVVVNHVHVDAVQALDVVVARLLEVSEIDLMLIGASHPVVLHVVGVFKEHGEVEHHFLGHAAHVYASASDNFVFNQGDLLAELCSAPCRGDAATARADDDVVKGFE